MTASPSFRGGGSKSRLLTSISHPRLGAGKGSESRMPPTLHAGAGAWVPVLPAEVHVADSTGMDGLAFSALLRHNARCFWVWLSRTLTPAIIAALLAPQGVFGAAELHRTVLLGGLGLTVESAGTWGAPRHCCGPGAGLHAGDRAFTAGREAMPKVSIPSTSFASPTCPSGTMLMLAAPEVLPTLTVPGHQPCDGTPSSDAF